MTKHISYENYYDSYEYHGSTVIEVTRRQGRRTIWRDWLIFDTVQEAVDFFHHHGDGCCDISH